MLLREHISAMHNAASVKELERACRAAYDAFPFRDWPNGGRSHVRIVAARIKAGHALCDKSAAGYLVPRFDFRSSRLTVCGESKRVGRGQNGAGVLWVWAAAEAWALDVLKRNGVPPSARQVIWSWWGQYPHRALREAERVLRRKRPTTPIQQHQRRRR